MATEVQDPLGEAPAIAPGAKVPDYLAAQAIIPVPGVIGIPAAQMLSGGTSADLARQAAALIPPPDPADYRAKQQAYADKVLDYVKTGGDFRDSYQAKADEVDEAARQYQQKANDLLPQTANIQPAPPRSLRGFLAPTENEDPYTTVSKFMQSVSLLATMMGGGRNGARASISAMTGAVEGWTKGDRYRADSEYQTWKDTTEALFRQFDDEMRRYNSIMIAERVPMESKLRALETTAYQQKNMMAMKAFEVGQAKDAFEHMDKMKQAAVQAQFEAAKVQGSYEHAADQRAQFEARLTQATENFNKQLDAKEAQMKLQMAIAQLGSDTKLALLQQKIDQGVNLQKPSDRQQKTIEDAFQTGSILNRLDDLMGKVDLRKLVGGINPWKNSLIQKWGKADSPAPPTDASAPAIKVSGALTNDEQQFLALLKDYGDTVLRQRSGASISQYELENLLQFVPDPSQSPATVRSRLAMARQKNISTLENQIKVMKAMGVRTPDLSGLQPASIGGNQATAAPAPGSKLEGNEWVSESGKYVWRGGQWVAR